MNLRYLFLIGCMLMVGSCRQGDVMNSLPSDVLTREQMIPLLVDIHLTEASLKLNQAGIQPKEVKLYYSSAYSPVFKKHKTSPKQFDRSLQWYTKHIDELDEIYTEVITRLSKLETQLKVVPKVIPVKKVTQPDTSAKNTKPITPAKNKLKLGKPLQKK